jgi:ethanolamine transporter EutH
MPVLTPIYGEILAAFVTIIVGIVMEKWYVSWWSVGINVINLIVVLMALTLDTAAMVILALYVILGLMSAFYRVTKAYFLFGAKTYGSLTLTLGLLSLPDWNQRFVDVAYSLAKISAANTTGIFILSWVIIVVLVHIIGEFYNVIGPSVRDELSL